MSPAEPETAHRATTVEVFFDVVFVFTITQLTGVLEDDLTWAGFGIVVLVLGLLWYPYTGYAWLTNQVPPRGPAQKIPLFAGMAGFLLTSVAIPAAFTETALLFALGYLVLTGVHLGIHAVVAHPDAPAGTAAALALAGGVTLYLTGVGAARLALRLRLPLSRPAGAVAVLATVPLGVWTVAGAQLVAVIVVLIAMLLTGPRHPTPRTARG